MNEYVCNFIIVQILNTKLSHVSVSNGDKKLRVTLFTVQTI